MEQNDEAVEVVAELLFQMFGSKKGATEPQLGHYFRAGQIVGALEKKGLLK